MLCNLLAHAIPSYKAYTNMGGYDIVARNPDKNTSARIQVKSRWRTGANGFIINKFECDFVVVVLLNRGSKDGKAKVLPPDFYVFPVRSVQAVHDPSKTWGKLLLSRIKGFREQQGNWESIRTFLNRETNPSIKRTAPAAQSG